MHVCAGRGPLVRASLAAAKEAGRQLRIYAVEKNPAAIVHIQSMVNAEGWHDKVTIIAQDMRSWDPPEKVLCQFGSLALHWILPEHARGCAIAASES